MKSRLVLLVLAVGLILAGLMKFVACVGWAIEGDPWRAVSEGGSGFVFIVFGLLLAWVRGASGREP